MKCCGVAAGHTEAVACVALSQRASNYSSNQAFVVSGAGDKILKRWAVPVRSIAAYKDISGSKFSGDDDAIITMVASHSVRAHDKDINTVAVSPNDALVASGSQDNTIRIWRSSDLAPLATLSGHKRGVWHIAFSPVDRSLASASGDRTVRLWSLNDNTCLRTFQGHTASVLNVKFVNHGLQLMSSGSDGLLNLWTIGSGELVETFDLHADKVWGLSNVSNNLVLTGGSDARLVLWKDVTEEVENERLLVEEKNLLLEQSLANDIRNKNYSKAFSTALTLGHTNKLISILMSILDADFDEDDHSSLLASRVHSRVSRLNQYVEVLADEELEKLIGYLVDWNTNARFSFVSQALIASLFSSIRLDRLQKLRKFVDAAPGLVAYTERHYQRLDRLHEATYLIEFISGQVGAMIPASA
jgi:U3 small nucleolar RNA-associated protein 13